MKPCGYGPGAGVRGSPPDGARTAQPRARRPASRTTMSRLPLPGRSFYRLAAASPRVGKPIGRLRRARSPIGESAVARRAWSVAAGKPFAVSNRYRGLFAPLGNGRVRDDGCLLCPWQAASYCVGTGAMVRGPQGALKPRAGAVVATTGARSLKTFPVEVRERAIWLVGRATVPPRRRSRPAPRFQDHFDGRLGSVPEPASA